MKIRILIVDDHIIFRTGLSSLIGREPEMEVVGEASDGLAAVGVAAELAPDIVLMDVSLPGLGGVDATRRIKEIRPETKVLILTVHEDEGLLLEAIRAGASGYVVKNAAESDLHNAIRTVCQGDMYIHATMTPALVKNLSPKPVPQRRSLDLLTPREVDVLRLLVRGNTNRQIAGKLSLSQRTVEGYRATLISKLNLKSRVDLINFAEEHGLLDNGE